MQPCTCSLLRGGDVSVIFSQPYVPDRQPAGIHIIYEGSGEMDRMEWREIYNGWTDGWMQRQRIKGFTLRITATRIDMFTSTVL